MPELIDDTVGCVAASSTPAALGQALCKAVKLAADPKTPTRCVERASRWDWESAVGPAHEEVYGAWPPGASCAARSDLGENISPWNGST